MEIPQYILKSLDNLENYALPYWFNAYSVEKLEQEFSEKLKQKCKITKAVFYKTNKAYKEGKGKPYYIVWKESAYKKNKKGIKIGGK